MIKLKLSAIEDDKPLKLTVEVPAAVHRSLTAYAKAIGREQGRAAPEPIKLIVPMLERFMATDRAFQKSKRHSNNSTTTNQPSPSTIAPSLQARRPKFGSEDSNA
jgi:hypothetical protein